MPKKTKRTRTSGNAEALALLGLAQRAGAVAKGTEATRRALQRAEARLVVLAKDGSEAQREKVLPLARARGVPWEILGTRQELGDAVGSGLLSALAVTRGDLVLEIRDRLGRE